MEQTYDHLAHLIKRILEPPPLNQLGMADYYRNILGSLSAAKQIIEQLETYYKHSLSGWAMEEEF